jgi:uncharacterized protein (DUF1697 family)
MPKAKPRARATAPLCALFVQGINVGRDNALPMAKLRELLGEAGAVDVSTYIQSGNAVFRPARPLASFSSGLAAGLARYMKRPVAFAVRSADELADLLAHNPFTAEATSPEGAKRVCVTFLARPPLEGELDSLAAVEVAPARFSVRGPHIFSWHPMGQAKSRLALALSKLKLPGVVTTRNWNTVVHMHAMLADPAGAQPQD